MTSPSLMAEAEAVVESIGPYRDNPWTCRDEAVLAIFLSLQAARAEAWQRGSDETRYSIMVPPNPYRKDAP